jgi:hypothetical protein
MIQLHEESGRHTFERFVTLKWMLETPETLGLIVAPLAFSKGRSSLASASSVVRFPCSSRF